MKSLRELRDPLVIEQWVNGTYVVCGTFFINGADITPAAISNAIRPLYLRTRKVRRSWWPRGVAGYFIIPIFCADSFDERVVAFVQRRMPFSWAIWPEPLLYLAAENTAKRRMDYGLHGAVFYPHLSRVMDLGISAAAKLHGHDFPPTVNGRQIRENA